MGTMVSTKGSLSYAPATWNKYLGKNQVANMAMVGRKYNASNTSKLASLNAKTNIVVKNSKALNSQVQKAIHKINKNTHNAKKHYNTAVKQLHQANKEMKNGNIKKANNYKNSAKINLRKAKNEIKDA